MNSTDPLAELRAIREARRRQIDEQQPAQIEAARRLYAIAQGDSGQSRRVAFFLLGLYDGERFPFDLNELRGLDLAIFEDCLLVLRLDYWKEKEIQHHLNADFEQLAEAWGESR